jgi:hypothetical protein
MPWVNGFKQEIETIASNVFNEEADISNIVKRKKNNKLPTKQLSSTLSLFLQSEEHTILTTIDKSLQSQGRSMDTYIYDGGLVRMLKDEQEFPSFQPSFESVKKM